MDIITTKPSGSLYVFGSLENYNISSSLDFSYDLLDKKQVAIVPGLAFGIEGFFRVSCTLPLEKLEVAMDKLEEYLVDKK
jgi:aspartate/methionine/tyrosine aminotransferase